MPLSKIKRLDACLLAMAVYTVLWVCVLWAWTTPDEIPVEFSCSCAGKADCQTIRFDTDGTGERLAACAIDAGGEVCCYD